jgi:hypothetical protein
MQEVTGSIPVFSTRRKSTARKRVVFFCCCQTSEGLAHPEERLHGMQEVTGSIPVFSTKKHCTSFEVRCFSFYIDAEKGGDFPQKGKSPPLMIIG